MSTKIVVLWASVRTLQISLILRLSTFTGVNVRNFQFIKEVAFSIGQMANGSSELKMEKTRNFNIFFTPKSYAHPF